MVTCAHCGIEFRKTPSQATQSRHCSHQCRRRAEPETTLERAVRKILEAEGLAYEAQVGIGRWVVDFVVGDRVIVEANGTYWHRKRPTVEARRIAKLQEMGYRVVVVTDRERDLRGALLGRLRDESASAPISA